MGKTGRSLLVLRKIIWQHYREHLYFVLVFNLIWSRKVANLVTPCENNCRSWKWTKQKKNRSSTLDTRPTSLNPTFSWQLYAVWEGSYATDASFPTPEHIARQVIIPVTWLHSKTACHFFNSVPNIRFHLFVNNISRCTICLISGIMTLLNIYWHPRKLFFLVHCFLFCFFFCFVFDFKLVLLLIFFLSNKYIFGNNFFSKICLW